MGSAGNAVGIHHACSSRWLGPAEPVAKRRTLVATSLATLVGARLADTKGRGILLRVHLRMLACANILRLGPGSHLRISQGDAACPGRDDHQ